MLRFVALICLISYSYCLDKCIDILRNNETYSGLCSDTWVNLKSIIKPTQKQVGFAWIQYKVAKDYSTSKDAQKNVNDGTTPAVIGPDNFLYVVDDHHSLCALDYSGFDTTTVTLNILCDKRSSSISDFWADLSTQNLVYLAALPDSNIDQLPVQITYDLLPTSFSFNSKSISFEDDAWRALAGFSRKVTAAAPPAPSCSTDKYCQRCMFRGCVDGYQKTGGAVCYFEFRWAYFMIDSVYYNTALWGSDSDLLAFKTEFEKLPHHAVGKDVNTDDWFAAANYIVALCRSAVGKDYLLPTNLYPGDSKLPGFFSGYVPLESDPTCDSPVCK